MVEPKWWTKWAVESWTCKARPVYPALHESRRQWPLESIGDLGMFRIVSMSFDSKKEVMKSHEIWWNLKRRQCPIWCPIWCPVGSDSASESSWVHRGETGLAASTARRRVARGCHQRKRDSASHGSGTHASPTHLVQIQILRGWEWMRWWTEVKRDDRV